MPAAIVTLVVLGLAVVASPAAAAPVQRPGGHYYEYVASQLTWGAAETYAEDRHAHLATIADAAENAFVQGLVTGDTAWLGGTDQASEGTWAWVTPEAFTYTNWAPAEPDDEVLVGGNGDGLAMRQDGTWIDTNPAFTTFVEHFVIEWTNDTPDLDADGLYGNDDPDDDNDNVADGSDNCQTASNTDQVDTDGDGAGDECDADDDDDGTPDVSDNCRISADHTDTDGDGTGDACDFDDDGDGTPDGADPYPLDPTNAPPGSGQTPPSGSGQTPPPGGTGTVDSSAPVLSARLANSRVRLRSLRKSRRVKFRVTTDESADVVVTATRRGRKVGTTRVTTVGGVGQSLVLKIAKRAIKRGTLKIAIVATDAAHNSSRTTLKITVH